ncbi:MAG TPA: YqjK family protein [Noviherbaspirillum sp.]|nr:YqjK family protein [Noviherbaspirillum sp.]
MPETPQRKKARLLAQSAALRIELARSMRPLGYQLRSAESGARSLARLQFHPEWIAGAMMVIALLRPERISSWVRGMTHGLRTWRRFAPLLEGVLRRG